MHVQNLMALFPKLKDPIDLIPCSDFALEYLSQFYNI